MGISRITRSFTIAALLVLILAASASATTPKKKWYWTQPRAESTVTGKIGIPECWIWPDNRCTNPPGPFWASGGTRLHPATADCTGADEYRASFMFNRFVCKIVVDDGNGVPAAKGTIALYVTGSTTFRWKLLS